MANSGRAERESRARVMTSRIIPDVLRSSPRAKHGISRADLIVDPPPVVKTPTSATAPIYNPNLTIRVTSGDSLQAAARYADRPYAGKRTAESRRIDETQSTVTILNMASLHRPGGNFLTGGNGQEEFLCHRSTLWASLFDDLYSLPDIGGLFTPDVLCLKDVNSIDLPRRERFFVNVISAGLERHPENKGRYDDRDVSCSCGVSYCDRDRDIMLRKMKAVMRMAQMNATKQLILGAWGCGSQKHPVREVAKLWRRVIAGSPRQRRPIPEQWEGIEEVVFAIPNPGHAREFRRAFEEILAPDYPFDSPASTDVASEAGEEDPSIEKLIAQASSLELQIETARSTFLKNKFQEDLRAVNHELALGRAAKASRDDDNVDEDVEDDFVVAGFHGSDGEDNSFYRVDGTTSDSDSDGAKSEVYEFRFASQPGIDSSTSQDEDDLEECGWEGFPPSPHFDPSSGWFKGSINQLANHVYGSGRRRDTSISPRSPLVELESNTAHEGAAVDEFLTRFQRDEIDDQS